MANAENPLLSLSSEKQQQIVDLVDNGNIEAIAEKGGMTRRQVLQVAVALGAGATVGGYSVDQIIGEARAAADTSDSDGNVGLPGDRVDVFAEGVDVSGEVGAGSVSAGEVNNETAVKTESDLTNVLTNGQSGYIPPGVTVGMTDWIDIASGARLDIFGTLKQADNADVAADYLLQARSVDDVTIRLFGTYDGNQANQSTSQTNALNVFDDGSGPPEDVAFYGPGTVTGMQGNEIFKDNGGLGTYFGGFSVRGWVPNNLNDAFVTAGSGNSLSEMAQVDNVTFYGGTFGGTAGDGDCITVNDADHTGFTVQNCEFYDSPRRCIQGADYAIGNRAVNVGAAGGGGDAIAGVSVVTHNVLYGTYDGNGDNGIVQRSPGTVANNYVEGFSNNGILQLNPGGNGWLQTFRGNILVDNNQNTNDTANMELRDTNSNGGWIAKGNVSIADSHSPTYGIHVEGGSENGRLTENIIGGTYGTAAVQDDSPSSTTVADNIVV